MRDLAWLAREDDLHSNLYLVESHPAGGYAAYTADESIPWPVALLLGSHSLKHRFERPRTFAPSHIYKATQDFGYRLKWAWIFRKKNRR